jgi:hypothetical protein
VISRAELFYELTGFGILYRLGGMIYFDKTDRVDSALMIERSIRTLRSGNSIAIYPEGTPNVYGREMFNLYPGVIRLALETGAIVMPVGNEINIIRDKNSKKIIGDTNYYMYEDYNGGQTFFRPSDDIYLSTLFKHFNNQSYTSAVDNTEVESFIHNGKFISGDIVIDLEGLMKEFLQSHPSLDAFYHKFIQTQTNNTSLLERVNAYLVRCSLIWEFRRKQTACLDILHQRMAALSSKICNEIDIRHPKSPEEHEQNSREYVDYYIKTLEKMAKIEQGNAYDVIDKYINITTAESTIASDTKKVLQGLELIIH